MVEDAQDRSGHRSGPFARRGLTAATFDSWTESLAEVGARTDRVLAWAPSVVGPALETGSDPGGPRAGDGASRDGVLIGTRGRLSVGTPLGGTWTTAHWQHVGWHQIERGTWNAEARRLSWTPYEGRPEAVALTEPGRLPELFRERIAASIAVEEMIQISDGRTLAVSGRRDLARPDSPIEWRTSLGRGLSWQQPGLRSLADQTLARMRAEYDRL